MDDPSKDAVRKLVLDSIPHEGLFAYGREAMLVAPPPVRTLDLHVDEPARPIELRDARPPVAGDAEPADTALDLRARPQGEAVYIHDLEAQPARSDLSQVARVLKKTKGLLQRSGDQLRPFESVDFHVRQSGTVSPAWEATTRRYSCVVCGRARQDRVEWNPAGLLMPGATPARAIEQAMTEERSDPLMSPDVARYLEQTRIPLRLAAVTESGWPLVLSLWFVLRRGSLWCATQRSAKIVRHLRADPRCAFEVAPEQPPYRGVRGQGRASLHPAHGKEILETLLDRYLGTTTSPLARQLLSKSDAEVAIEVKPVTLFSWDYSDRMKGSLQE